MAKEDLGDPDSHPVIIIFHVHLIEPNQIWMRVNGNFKLLITFLGLLVCLFC